ncbi:MAG: hypothetical protein ACTHU0_21580 [Kofleriaceae bacterium]
MSGFFDLKVAMGTGATCPPEAINAMIATHAAAITTFAAMRTMAMWIPLPGYNAAGQALRMAQTAIAQAEAALAAAGITKAGECWQERVSADVARQRRAAIASRAHGLAVVQRSAGGGYALLAYSAPSPVPFVTAMDRARARAAASVSES